MDTKIYLLIALLTLGLLLFFILRTPMRMGKKQEVITLKGQFKGNSSMLLPIYQTGTYHLEIQLTNGELLVAHSSYSVATNSWVLISKEAKTYVSNPGIHRFTFIIEKISGELDQIEMINPKLFKPSNFNYTWKMKKPIAT
ncbi:hypothetical protein HXA34_10160 [Salipaludibacillus agaradhaerens]|jgi:hypothetical protein|uniref:hypothetical protein n=1 Tax=Salipaludibacillus agaradhaerens TaxID=76935 RepID=UPI002150B571|nr:hypothetical protein [Salipaludibacillus agaradhaerens]MCR6106647.1 hypothetical protein [Salipaludibacillus agaradhaerens]MCR6118680.1 hypothetical protein [Salipaludibacillus agaradhaerens]UJW57761.1 hypothetical protein HXZ66_10285 [Bacillus sp. A116_S68]